MRFTHFARIFVFFIVAVLSAGAAQAASTETVFDTHTITIFPITSPSVYLKLRVVDPKGKLAADIQSDGKQLSWNLPAVAPEGRYRFEIRHATSFNGSSTVTSGSFTVIDGAIVLAAPEAKETGLLDNVRKEAEALLAWGMGFLASPVHADQQISDDLIVTQSGCIGTDCTNGEVFDFATLRLKENNLRLHFNDTSTSASFPSNDWTLSANDSSNGGDNYFAIEDTSAGKRPFFVLAGSSTNTLVAGPKGVGIGTGLPLAPLHVVRGNTPMLRLEQDGSEGWAASTWDIGANEVNLFFRKGGTDGPILFALKNDTGNLGLGTAIPKASLDLARDKKDCDIAVTRKESDGTSTIAKVEATQVAVRMGSVTDQPLQLMANSQPVAAITSAGRLGVGTTAPEKTLHVTGSALITGNLELGSSRDLKFNITDLSADDAMEAFSQLAPVRYRYKTDPEEESLGFIAEEVPDLVATNSRKSVSPMDVVAVLTRVVQDQQAVIRQNRKTIEELTRRIEALEN